MEENCLEFISNNGVEHLAQVLNARRPVTLAEYLTSPNAYILLRDSNNLYKIIGDRMECITNIKVDGMYYVDGVL